MSMVSSSWPDVGKHGQGPAEEINQEIKASVDGLIACGQGRPKLVGFLAADDTNNSEIYARMTRRACEKNGIEYELRKVERFELEAGVIEANSDPTVHGIIVYYPVFGGGKDMYLRDVVSYEKDVEGLNHRYRYSMYHNIRFLETGREGAGAPKKCVLPCTPLACVKILESLGAYDKSKPVGKQLEGRTCMVYNRSEVVGRPLAAMLANDGAVVYSVDEHGMLVYTAGAVGGTIKVDDTDKAQFEALSEAEIVVSGVPSEAFKVTAESMRPGAIAINVSQFMNFGDGVDEKCALVPAIGKVTIAVLARNLLRLHQNFHQPSPPEGERAVSAPVAVAAALEAPNGSAQTLETAIRSLSASQRAALQTALQKVGVA